MLDVKDVVKSYDKSEVLHGISLCVDRGEIHGLIGENSAGKTTLIKCVVGIYKADEGSVTFENEPVYDNPKVKERIGYVADYNEYISFYTPKRMVKMYQRFYPKFDVVKFNEFNEIFNLPLEKTIHSLSKGQRTRLALMLEFAKNPEYIILDEPTSGLDPVAKEAFYKLLVKETEENNLGVLISSHNLDGLEKICDSVTMMHQGYVERQLRLMELQQEFTRVNAVFKNAVQADLEKRKDIRPVNVVGSIYTLLVKDYDDSKEEELRSLGATFIETSTLSLEELFIALEDERRR